MRLNRFGRYAPRCRWPTRRAEPTLPARASASCGVSTVAAGAGRHPSGLADWHAPRRCEPARKRALHRVSSRKVSVTMCADAAWASAAAIEPSNVRPPKIGPPKIKLSQICCCNHAATTTLLQSRSRNHALAIKRSPLRRGDQAACATSCARLAGAWASSSSSVAIATQLPQPAPQPVRMVSSAILRQPAAAV